MSDSIEFLEQHCEFNILSDCYVLMGISRKKDTADMTSSKEIIFKEVIKNKEDIKKKYLAMKAQIENYKDENGRSYPFYMYISLNPRNARRATEMLMNTIMRWFSEEVKDRTLENRYKFVHSEFFSCLMNPSCRGSKKYFMLDVDTHDPDILLKEVVTNKYIPSFDESRLTRNGFFPRSHRS